MAEQNSEQPEVPPVEGEEDKISRGSIFFSARRSIRESVFFSARSRESYEQRKSDLEDAQEELCDVYHHDDDSPLFDLLDTMLFGKIHGTLSRTPNRKPIHLQSLTMRTV
jgi:hypothetical protein